MIQWIINTARKHIASAIKAQARPNESIQSQTFKLNNKPDVAINYCEYQEPLLEYYD